MQIRRMWQNIQNESWTSHTSEEASVNAKKCNCEFRQEAALKSHSKAYNSGKIEGDRKECRIFNNLVGRTNYARHVRSCKQRNNLQEDRAAHERRSDQIKCKDCEKICI